MAESEYDGVGVELSGVYDNPEAAMTAADKLRLGIRTGQMSSARVEPTARAKRGMNPTPPRYPFDA